jgi:hypothetical protein
VSPILIGDVAFKNLREVRNVLTHRVAPACQFYIAPPESLLPPAEWKIVNIALDATTTTTLSLARIYFEAIA